VIFKFFFKERATS